MAVKHKDLPGMDKSRCPCGSGLDFSSCCNLFLSGADVPATAEQLMRSRYSGFVVCNEPYLLATWHPDTRPSCVRFDENQRWLGLKIKSTDAGGAEDATGKVEFVARFKIDGKGHRLHEVSRFEQIDGQWYYLDGDYL